MRKKPVRRRIRLDWAKLEERRVPTTLIALIDSGVDLTSTADAPYYDFTSAYDSYDKVAINGSNHGFIQDTSLQHGHGSTVADFIAAGIADAESQPGAPAGGVQIMPIRDTAAGGLEPDSSAMIRGVYWAVDHGASVINLSFRRYNGDFVSDTDPSDPHYGTTLSQAIQYAQSKGAMVVTASGNESINLDDPNRYGPYIMPGSAGNPAHNGLGVALDNVLVTAAVDGSNKLTQYTNWGPASVNIGAPTGPGTNAVTSYSTGYTSGVAGVIAALTPGDSAGQRIALIEQTAVPAPQSVGVWSTSGGVISPAGAVRRAIALFPPQAGTQAVAPPVLLAAGSGSGVVAGSFVSDAAYVDGGNLDRSLATISTSGLANPAPQAVYQTERWTSATMTYTIPNLKAGSAYDVRLDFAETFYTQPGQRSFNVAINGSPVLTNFDINAAAGGPLKAIAESFSSIVADASGHIAISFTNITGGAKVNGIEVTPTQAIELAAGSSSASGSFAADAAYAVGGSTYSVPGQAIDTSGVANPAPQLVYQSERWDGASFAEVVPGLVPGASYAVRLDFSENFYSGPGQRAFNVAINGNQVLGGFDIDQAAGGRFKAVARTFNAVADPSGKITIGFTNVRGGAKVDGIEVTPSSSTPTQVDLGGLDNVVGLTADGNSTAGNLDGTGASYSATFLGSSVVNNGSTFSIGPVGANDAVLARGQTIATPSGNSRTIRLLATGVNGAQSGSFLVHYTDGSTSTVITQTFDDWHLGVSASNESVAATMSYRNRSGTRDDLAFDLYAYSFAIDPTRTIASITLPNNPNIAIFAVDLAP